MKEANLYKKLDNLTVKCLNCPRYCVIKPGQKGFCHVRENKKGKLIANNYGRITELIIRPIERVPMYHYLPGTETLSVACAGCNLMCASCSTWCASQRLRLNDNGNNDDVMTAKEIVDIAKKEKVPSITYSGTEPVAYSEFALDVMKLAKKEGIKNIWVTNGFWSEELFDKIIPYLDAVNIDLKGFSNEFYHNYCMGELGPILEICKKLKKHNVWTEVTTLVIPQVTDNKSVLKNIASFISVEMDKDTPWHIHEFSAEASWKLKEYQDTPKYSIKRAVKEGRKAGLKYVYSPIEKNTFCPKCMDSVINRGKDIVQKHEKGKCPSCGSNINIFEA